MKELRLRSAAGVCTVVLALFTVTAYARSATVSPSQMQFPNQRVGTTSSALSVTLQNDRHGKLQISGIQVAAPFAQTNNCGRSLGPNQQCTIAVTFAPTAMQSYSASLVISDNASNSPQTVALSGSGVMGVSFSPAQVSFPNQATGTTSSASAIRMTNSGSTALAISSIQTAAPFAVTNNCGGSLAAGGSCTLSVTFSPTAVQSYSGAITVMDSDASSPQTMPLSGAGVSSGTVAYTPKLLAFPNQALNSTSAPLTTTITNNESSAVSITGISTAAPFAETSNCGTSLGAGQSCTVSVTFSPTVVKYYTGTLTITDSATSPLTVSLTGNGIQAVKWSPAAVSFPQEAVGTTSSGVAVTVTNEQSGPLTISSIQTAAPFAQTNNCGTSLAGGQSCTVTVTFSPTAVQYYSGNLTITDDGTNSPQVIGLNGNGVVAVATLPKVGGLYFVHQIVNTSSTPQPVTLTNNLNTPLTFSGISSSAVFPFTTNCGDGNGGGTLAAGASCTIQVSFDPTSTVTYNVNLTINSNSPGGAVVVPLTGTGISGTQGAMVNVKPHAPCLTPGETLQFAADVTSISNTAVSWYVNGVLGGNSTVGTISSSGAYTAPPTANSYQIKAVSQGNTSISGTAYASVTTTPNYQIYPFVSSIPTGGQQTFQAQDCQVPDQRPVTFTVDNIAGGNGTVGTVSSTGVYTAPATPGKHTVRVTDAALGRTSGAVVTVFSAITADFGGRANNTAVVPANMFGYGRGESIHSTADRQLLTQGGLTVSRMSAQIWNVFKNGSTPNWTLIDPMIAQVQAAGQHAILQMNQSPPWLEPTSGACAGNAFAAPTDNTQWATIAVEYVAHMDATFPGVVQDYEIWNEPNSTGMCSTQDHMTTYMALYAAAAPGMKAQASQDGATVRVGGPVVAGYAATWFQTLMSNPSTAPYVDFLSYHQYLFGSSQLQVQWDQYTGDPSLYEDEQDPSVGAQGVYSRVVQLAAQGSQPLGAQVPIYVTEYNTNWSFFQDCCRNDPTYAPVFNALYAMDMLNSVYNNVAHVPNQLDYFAGNAYPYFCLIGVQDSGSDCLYSTGATPVPYPQYYAYDLIASPQYLGLATGGYMAKSISTPTGGGGLATTAFYTANKDAVVITNPTSTPYSQITVTLANPGLTGTQGTLYQIVNGSQVTTTPISFTVSGTNATTTINVPAYSVQAVSLP
jgi:hypothetical protein